MTKSAAPKVKRSIRLSDKTWSQIAALAQAGGQSQPEVVAIAVDRMYRWEYPPPEEEKK